MQYKFQQNEIYSCIIQGKTAFLRIVPINFAKYELDFGGDFPVCQIKLESNLKKNAQSISIL